MKGVWVQAESGTWHLIWNQNNQDLAEGIVVTWCNKTFGFDDPQKPGSQLASFEDILHDECVRKSEDL